MFMYMQTKKKSADDSKSIQALKPVSHPNSETEGTSGPTKMRILTVKQLQNEI